MGDMLRNLLKGLSWFVAVLFIVAVMIDVGQEFLVLLFKVIILFLLSAVFIVFANRISLFPKKNIFGQLAAFTFYLILSLSVCVTLEQYLINNCGWTWLYVEPHVPDNPPSPPLRPTPEDLNKWGREN